MNTVKDKVAHKQCVGCFACQNACPKDAILLTADAQGFIYPEIDSRCVSCGACVSVCPVLEPEYDNASEPSCYAYRAEDDIRKHSSSGGVFSVLARHFLESGAYVCGAVFDEDFSVKHIVTNLMEDVRRMSGSKYVQSNINFCYSQIRTLLQTGHKVLFSGTPCQVAALNSYLGKKYDNLYSIDLVCFGVPSAMMLKQHLCDVAKGKTIRQISFRDKRYGWHKAVLRVEFADGSEYEGTGGNDAYMKGFFMDIIMRESCGDCPFCRFPRQGDMSIGDYWGYESLVNDDKDNLGTSIIFPNNCKGDALLNILHVSNQLYQKTDINPDNLPNRLKPRTDVPVSRGRLFSLLQSKTFAEAIHICQSNTFDVGLVGPYHNSNVGGFLTYYALYHAICDMGYSVLLIDRPKTAPCKLRALDDFSHPHSLPAFALARQYANAMEMRNLNAACGQFVVGSDQIFRPLLYNGWGDFTKLDWVEDNKKKIAYAASFGTEHFDGTEEQRANLGYFLAKFDAFSVREKSGVAICRDEFGINAVHVLDPVFLCGKDHYQRLAALGNETIANDERFVHGYFLAPTKDKVKLAEELAREWEMSSYIFSEFGTRYDEQLHINDGNINLRLHRMINCRFSITDSFHGLCMAIIFQKNFILWANQNAVLTRIISLLEELDLMDRLVYNYADFIAKRNILIKPINWSTVIEKLSILFDYSKQWLATQLGKNVVKNKSDYDMIINMRKHIENDFTERLNAIRREFMAVINNLKSQM